MFKMLWNDEDGLTTVEYALLLALMVVAGIGAWSAFGGKIQAAVTNSGTQIDAAATAAPAAGG